MIHFVVVAGTPAAVRTVSPRLSNSLYQTRLFDGDVVERRGTSRTWAVAAIALPDPTCEARLVTVGDAMVVINGPALAIGGEQRRLAEDLLRKFTAAGSAAVARALSGSYNFIGVAPSHGLRGFVDFSGLFPIYWHEGLDLAVFSNRSTTIAKLIGSKGWDLRSLAWVIGHANLFGDRMPASGASYLLPGSEAQVDWGDGRVRLDVSPHWPWPPLSEDGQRDNLSPAEWDAVTDTLIGQFWRLAEP